MKPRLALAFLIFGTGAVAAQAPGSTELGKAEVEVPMDLSTKHIGLEVSVGTEGPFRFNLDTYAVTSACVDQSFAKRMGFDKVGTARNGDGSGTFEQRDIVLIPEIRVGGAVFKDVQALVDDYSWVKLPEGGSIDGLLGYHLFSDLLLELDYPNERVVLRRGALAEEDPHVISYPALRNAPDIPVLIGDRSYVMGIDSGAQSGLSLPSAMMDELELAGEPALAGRAQTVYSEAGIFRCALAERFRFAGHEVEELEATFSEIFGKPLIGHDVLVGYSVTFDQQNGRVRFREPAARAR